MTSAGVKTSDLLRVVEPMTMGMIFSDVDDVPVPVPVAFGAVPLVGLVPFVGEGFSSPRDTKGRQDILV